MKRFWMLLWFAAPLAPAHPMGNFSVSHYARLEVTRGGVEVTYALDLAEIPTFDLLRSWNLDRNSPRELLEAKAREQAQVWLNGLRFSSNAGAVGAKLISSKLVIADGAGNLPIARITTRAHLTGLSGSLGYEDLNFPERAGWKEIVIVGGEGATLQQASHSGKDVSKGLTEYPADPTLAPPQDLRAQVTWSVEKPVVVPNPVRPEPRVVAIPQPKQAPAASAPALSTPAAAPAGSVVRGDFLSRLLHQREITPLMIVIGLAVAFLLGGAHALTPGHGKTIVAAYLVGSRGTMKHAAFLGAMVTFTHTISVFLLGLATLFLFRFIMPEKITQWLGVVSGLSIVAVGLWMAWKRWRVAAHERAHALGHHHHHHHHHGHHHDHGHDHGNGHDHHHHDHHHHGPGGHSHVPEEMSWSALIALGASGGLVPCESALVLLLGAIALGRVGLGLMLLLAFSAGLAAVLMAIGAVVLYAKNLLPDRKKSRSAWAFRYVPVASAAVVTVIGIVMTGVSLGWLGSRWSIG